METVEEHYDDGEFRRKVTRKSFKIEEVSEYYFLIDQRPKGLFVVSFKILKKNFNFLHHV